MSPGREPAFSCFLRIELAPEGLQSLSRARSGLSINLAQELNEQCAHHFRLFLLHPMPRAIHKMESDHMCAGAVAHLVDRTRRLIDAPIASPRDVLRGHVYG